MKIKLTQKTKNETITLEAKGFFLIAFLHFSNNPEHIKHRIRCGKALDRLRITEYYPPEYIKENNNYENINATIEKEIRHIKVYKKK